MDFAGACVKATGDPSVGNHVQLVARQKKRWRVRSAAVHGPGNISFVGPGANGHDNRPVKAGGDKDQAMGGHGPRHNRIPFSEGNVPDFLAGFWIQRKNAAAADGYDLTVDHEGGAERELLPSFRIPVKLPEQLAVVLIQGGNEGFIGAIAIENQCVSLDYRGSGVTVHRGV